MDCGYTKEVRLDFATAVSRTREELQKEGFGVLTEIDVKSTLKKKLEVEFDDYIILGACNPSFAHKALLAEKEIGLMMPCNVIVYRDKGKTFVSAVLPTSAMRMISNNKLKEVAVAAEEKLKKVIDSV
ncbi:MAG: DUF302 domain-containing protein [Candidatus Aenigmatarchaeota archaeon]